MSGSAGLGSGWRTVAVLVLLAAAAGCGGGAASPGDGGALGSATTGDAGSGGGGGDHAPGGAGRRRRCGRRRTTAARHAHGRCGPQRDRARRLHRFDAGDAADVAAGEHTIALTTSTLSKGSASDANDNPVPSFDDYVIVRAPAGEPASRRFFMLNGVGTTAGIHAVVSTGALQLMFIDSDTASNGGQGSLTIDAAGPSTTVDGTATRLRGTAAAGRRPPRPRSATAGIARRRRQHAVGGRRFEGRCRVAALAQREGDGFRLAMSS